MTELRITRSKDIELYIGDEQLFGVTDFFAKSTAESYPIREYLSGEPYAVVNVSERYALRLSVLSLFRYAALEADGFTLRAVDGDTAYCYEGCMVTGHEREIMAGKNVVDVFHIAAKGMRKQVQSMQDERIEYEERTDGDEAFAFLERDARRYHKAFGEEEEAKRV